MKLSRWHVVMTKASVVVRIVGGNGRAALKARGEPAVELELRDKGFETYCPRFLDTAPLRCPGSKRKPRLVAVTRALFPGYVFVCLPRDEDQVTARYARGVIDLVRSDDVTPLRLPEGEIEMLKASEGRHGLIPLSREQRLAWKAGEWARVLAGPFSGLEAQVRDDVGELGLEGRDGADGGVDREARISTLVSLFGRLVPVSIPPWHLERL